MEKLVTNYSLSYMVARKKIALNSLRYIKFIADIVEQDITNPQRFPPTERAAHFTACKFISKSYIGGSSQTMTWILTGLETYGRVGQGYELLHMRCGHSL